MAQYNIIAESQEYTVVAEYDHVATPAEAYQSEADLEKEFIRLLQEQGYEYLPIHTETDLISNLRAQLEKLNHYHFTDSEWEQFFNTCIANKNDDIVAKTAKIQDDYIQVLKRDTGESQNIKLIDKDNIHNNTLQVINQYVEEGGNYDTRYDVTVLVNGLPLVHIELKRRGVQLKEAFNQINRYQRDSFWAGCGLYEYVQIFVISNCTNKEILVNISKAIGSSMQLRSKKELIENFIGSVNANTDVEKSWKDFVQQRKDEDLKEIIESEHLKPQETKSFIDNSFRDGQVRTTGTDIDKILPPMSRFGGGNRQEKKKSVIDKIQAFFERYFGL